MSSKSLRIFSILTLGLCCHHLSSQGNFTWFSPENSYADQKASEQFADCRIEKDEVNKLSDKKVLEYIPRPLFVYNHPQIRKYMVNEFLMEAQAYVNKVGDNHFMIIQFLINSDKAKNNYGNLEKGGKIKVSLIGADHIYLENIERDRGKVKRNAKRTIYTGTYAINEENLKSLKKHALDKITVLWEEGVEDYHIQNIDLIRQQLNCVEQ